MKHNFTCTVLLAGFCLSEGINLSTQRLWVEVSGSRVHNLWSNSCLKNAESCGVTGGFVVMFKLTAYTSTVSLLLLGYPASNSISECSRITDANLSF